MGKKNKYNKFYNKVVNETNWRNVLILFAIVNICVIIENACLLNIITVNICTMLLVPISHAIKTETDLYKKEINSDDE